MRFLLPLLLCLVPCFAAAEELDALLMNIDATVVAQCEAALRAELDRLAASRVGPIVLTEERFTRKLPDGSVQVSQYWGRAPMQAYPFFEAHDLLGDPKYLRVALDLADYYLSVEEPEGFWHYAHIVKPDGTARRLELAEAKGRAVCRIQDTHQTGCFRLMLYAWRVTGDEKYLAAAKRCGDYLLSIQNENGSWPDWWIPGHRHSDPNPAPEGRHHQRRFVQRRRDDGRPGNDAGDVPPDAGSEICRARAAARAMALRHAAWPGPRSAAGASSTISTTAPLPRSHFETPVIDPRTFGRFVAPLCAWFYVMSGEERYMTLMQETVDWIKSVETPDGWAYQYLPDGTPCFSLDGKVYRHDRPDTWPKAFPKKHDGIQRFTRDNGGPGDAPHFLAAWRQGGREALQAMFAGSVTLSPEEYERTRLSAAKWVASQQGPARSPSQFSAEAADRAGPFQSGAIGPRRPAPFLRPRVARVQGGQLVRHPL